MALRIEQAVSQSILSGQAQSGITSGRLSVQARSGQANAPSSLSSVGEAANSVTALSFEATASTAENATNRIAALRAEQLSLAEQASQLAIGDPDVESLSSRFTEIQGEIERIGSTATANGNNVLEGRTLGGSTAVDGRTSQNAIVSIADSRTLLSDPGEITDPASAESVAASLESQVSSALQLRGSAARSADAVSTLTDPKPTEVTADLERQAAAEAESIEDAEEATEEVTSQILSTLGSDASSEDEQLARLIETAS